MNQKQYKRLLQGPKELRPKGFFKYRNLAEKILGYKRNSGLVIHHLRDTEEQQKFNDEYYERWGIDFDGTMKYCILVDLETHKCLHTISAETKIKISKAVSEAKTRLTSNERKENKQKADQVWNEKHSEDLKQYKKEYYLKHKEKIKQRVIDYKKEHPDCNRLATKRWKIKNKKYKS